MEINPNPNRNDGNDGASDTNNAKDNGNGNSTDSNDGDNAKDNSNSLHNDRRNGAIFIYCNGNSNSSNGC